MEKKDIGLGAIAIAFGAWMFFAASQMKSGPDFWPKIVAAGIIILGAVILAGGLLQMKKQGAWTEAEREKRAKDKAQYLKVLAVVAVLIAYYFAFQYIGYTIPTFLLITATAVILGYRNWKVMIPTALIVSVALYLAFTNLFGIRFPGMFF